MDDTLSAHTLGQVEWALWRWVRDSEPGGAKPSSVFRTRIRRLIEVDRTRRAERDELPASRFAFQDHVGRGSGVGIRYTPFNAFCLALGLDLLDIGFKQAEVVYLLRHILGHLRREFDLILRTPLDPSQLIGVDSGYHGPTYEHRGRRYQDRRHFMLVQKVEPTEALARTSKRRKLPEIDEPMFMHGIEELAAELSDGSPNHYRKTVIAELAYTAVVVTQYLAEAPTIRRGPR